MNEVAVKNLPMDASGDIINLNEILKELDIPNLIQSILWLDAREPGELIGMLDLMRKQEAVNEENYSKAA